MSLILTVLDVTDSLSNLMSLPTIMGYNSFPCRWALLLCPSQPFLQPLLRFPLVAIITRRNDCTSTKDMSHYVVEIMVTTASTMIQSLSTISAHSAVITPIWVTVEHASIGPTIVQNAIRTHCTQKNEV